MEIGIKHILLFITIVVFIGVFYRVISTRLYNIGKEGMFGTGGMGNGMGGMGKGMDGMDKGMDGMDKGMDGTDKGMGGMDILGKTNTPKPNIPKPNIPKPDTPKPNTPTPTTPMIVQAPREKPPNTSCDNPYSDSNTLPLREYIIKACYNSAYDPNATPKLSVNILETRMAEGYRFIDLNVFSSEGKLYVGYSPNNNPTLTDVSIPFTDALECIKTNAFTKSTMAIKDDTPFFERKSTETAASIRETYVDYPLFVCIRVYRSGKSKLDIVKALMEHLKSTSDAKYLREGNGDNEKAVQIDGCTPLNKIKGNILFVMDILNILQIYTPVEKSSADQIPEETRKYLNKFVNIYSGGNIWRHGSSEKSMPLLISDLNQPYKTNLFNMQIMFPEVKETVNPDTYKLIVKNSIQTIVVRPYLQDTNLKAYTKLFNEAKRPMVCGVHAYTFVKGEE